MHVCVRGTLSRVCIEGVCETSGVGMGVEGIGMGVGIVDEGSRSTEAIQCAT
jgi:hypothetical protein